MNLINLAHKVLEYKIKFICFLSQIACHSLCEPIHHQPNTSPYVTHRQLYRGELCLKVKRTICPPPPHPLSLSDKSIHLSALFLSFYNLAILVESISVQERLFFDKITKFGINIGGH